MPFAGCKWQVARRAHARVRAVESRHAHAASGDPKLLQTAAKRDGWNSTQQQLRLGLRGATAEEPKGSERRVTTATAAGCRGEAARPEP